jgi:hypothetical protein
VNTESTGKKLTMEDISNSKAWYQPWSEEQFRADSDVQVMNCFEKWMYRTLCQVAFVCSTRPYLPDDDGQLWKLAQCESRKHWDKHKANVRAMFTVVERDGVRLLARKRILEDWGRLVRKRQQLAENGRKGGQRRTRQAEQDAESESDEAGPVRKTDFGAEVEESKVREEKEKNSHSHSSLLGKSQANAKQMLNDRMDGTDSLSSAASDKDIEQASAIGQKFFEITGKTLHVNGGFTTLARQHGFPTVLDAIERFARDGHDWSLIKNLPAFVLSRIPDYIAQAQAAIDAKQREIAEREEIEQIKAAATAARQAEAAAAVAEYERIQNDPNRYKIF